METISVGQEKDSAGAKETAGHEKKDSAAAEETVDIFESAREAQILATKELATHFRQMVNDPAFSDVAFKCTDGRQVHANKSILAGRSCVLKGIMNDMAESNICETNSGFSSSVLLSVFEFLYTGTLIDYLPENWRAACELIDGSRFFLLTELDMIIRKFMQTQIESVTTDLPKVATMLTEALEFKALCDPMDMSLRVLVKILASNLSDSTFIHILSEDAFHYFLANSKGKSEDLNKLSFREYFRFKQVIRWWVYQCYLGSSGREQLVKFIALDLEKALFICRIQSNVEVIESLEESESEEECEEEIEEKPEAETEEKPGSLSDRRNSLLLDEPSRNAAIRLLSNIDYRCIHPVILAEVVEPLRISSAEVMSAFRFHALCRPMVVKTLEWKHDEFYNTLEQGYVIRRTGAGKKIKKAVMNAAMSLPCGLFEWSFTLEELSEAVLQLGLRYTNDSKGALKLKLDVASTRTRWLASIRGSDFIQRSGRDKYPSKNTIKANSPILFSFNAFKQTCSCFLIDKVVTWSKLPSGICYPVVKLDPSYKGHVRIKLLSGFDVL